MAYAARAGLSEEFLAQAGPLVTPEIAGTALVELVQADAAKVAAAYVLNGAGLQKLNDERLQANARRTACCSRTRRVVDVGCDRVSIKLTNKGGRT